MTPIPPTAVPAPDAYRFQCAICGEGSKDICTWCTKDCCPLHRCERCFRCSDCCQCDTPQGKRANGKA